MRQLVALLAIIWAAGNAYASYLMVESGLRLVEKGLDEQLMLVSGGVLIGLFALLLVGQSARLFISRGESGT